MIRGPLRLRSPEPLEDEIHVNCARSLDALLLPPALWFTYPAGVHLGPAQQAKCYQIGLKRGLPDIWVLYGGVYCVELKRHGGRLSKTRVIRTKRGSPRILDGQEDVFKRLLETGAVEDIAICYSADDMLGQLAAWGIPLRTRIVPS